LIVYIGTFFRTVFPALRVGYLIVPKSLAPAFLAATWLSDLHSATLEQQSLAAFLTTGMYERHLQRLPRRNTARREALRHAVHKYLGETPRVDC
jgi:GntR family transcriptional regulator / MocR family aminotransferase